MTERKLVPKIRFKRFEEEWLKTDFGKIVFRNSATTDSKELRSVEYENIISEYGTVTKSYNNKKGIKFKKGDVLFGKLRPYLKNWILTCFEGKAVGDFWVLSSRKGFNSSFVFYLIQTNRFAFISNITTGTKMPRSDWNLVSNTSFDIPIRSEQQKIGNLFAKLDRLLDLQQQKLDQLELLKKALLQKLFPKQDAKIPELRFKGFEDEWKTLKFLNFVEKNSLKNKDLSNTNVESISNKTGFTKQSEQFDGYRVASSDLSNYYVIKEKQFAYNPSRINVGSIAYKKIGEKESVVSPLYVSFSTKSNINNQFLWFWFKTQLFTEQRTKLSEGGVRDTLPFENLKQMYIKAPKLSEQQKIGNLLAKVDRLIELENKKFSNLKLVKKSLLQNMFVE